MYRIERAPYGARPMFSEGIGNEEMRQRVEESAHALAPLKPGFGVFVDMRTLRPLLEDAKTTMQQGRKPYEEKGMARSVPILNRPISTRQPNRIAQESGIYARERYVDASARPDRERIGIA